MSLTTNPWVLKDFNHSSVYCIPYEFKRNALVANPVTYANASHVRPAILMFNSKSSAEIFQKQFLHNIVMCESNTRHWNLLGYYDYEDIESFVEAKLQLHVQVCDWEKTNIVFPLSQIQPQKLTDVDNDVLMTLTLCAYAIYFYIDTITFKNDYLEMKGILINPCTTISTQQDVDYRKSYITTHLNDMLKVK